MPQMMSTDTPAQEGNDLESPEREQAQTWSVPLDGLKVNGVAPSYGDICRFEVSGMAVGDASNGFINIQPKTINGYDVPNPTSADDTGDAEGSGPESNDENDDLEQARSQYNEQSMGGS